MEESLGLGFSGGGGSAVPNTGTPAFVSAVARDTNDIHDISHCAATSTQAHNGGTTSICMGAGMISMQQQQYNQQPPVPPPIFAAPPTHPSAVQQTTTYQYSPPTHQHPQTMQSQPTAVSMPYHQQMARPLLHFPAPPSIQPPTIPISAVPPQQAPSFQPPPGLPPGAAAPYFPHPPSNAVPHAPVQPSVVPAATSHFTSQFTQQPVEQSQTQQLDDPIEKARAIAMRLHQESTRGGIIDDSTIDSSIDYAQKRRDHFEKEKRKLQAFRLKNLEFVMKHEEKELRRHVECMNQMTAYEEKQQLQLELQKQQQRQRQLQLEQRQQEREQRGILNDGGGGIGSKEQRHAERARKRQHLDGSTKKATVGHRGAPKQSFRTSLYLTNLPTDGSTTERTLQSLFCLYGRLDRVTMYRHRSTGELKGDGLIVFGRDAAEEYRTKNDDGVDLVEAVCTQMNGAELPCGAVIGVQPASDDYKKAPNEVENTQQTASNGVANASVETKLDSATEANSSKEVSEEKATNDEEDLDDFFASLE